MTSEKRSGPIIKSKTGQVVSDKMDKTIVVRVDTLSPHPLYKKRVRKSKKFMCHDESNQARVGDFVRIAESRPTSAYKRWRLVDIVRPGGIRAVAQGLVDAELVEEQ
jgi:small subunit ribosomal protein S17